MNVQSSITENWAPCKPGQLRDLSKQLKRPTASSSLGAAGAAMAVCAAAVLGAGLYFARPSTSDAPTALACSTVIEHLAEYADGACEPELSQQIASHLETCSYCRRKLASIEQQHAARGSLPIEEAPGHGAALRPLLASAIGNPNE